MREFRVYLLLCLLFPFLFSFCTGCTQMTNIKDGTVTLSGDTTTYAPGTKEITVIWGNGLDEQISFGEAFGLEKKTNDSWETVGDGTGTFTTVLNIVSPHSSLPHIYYLDKYAGIESGTYRIATSYALSSDSKDTPHHVYFEFSIKK